VAEEDGGGVCVSSHVRPLGLLGVREEEGTWKKMSGCVDRWINIQRMENVTDEKIFFTPFISLMKFI
jgi:hypothetical protein